MGELVVQKAVIDFGAGQASAMEELAGASPLTVNMLRSQDGWSRLWPGTSAWDWFPTTIPAARASKIIGMTDWNGHLVFVLENRSIWSVDAAGLVTALTNPLNIAATSLDGGLRPTFAKARSNLFIAGGGLIQYWSGTGYSARVPSADAPRASHVVANADRIVACPPDRDGLIRWSGAGQGGPHLTDWDPLNFVGVDARPDPVVALHENSNELFAFGTETLQMLVPDETVGYAPSDAQNVGCKAPQGIINVIDSGVFAWLNQDDEFVVGDGRSSDYLSRPNLTATLKQLGTTSDAIGWQMRFGNFDLLVWSFPTVGRAFAYERSSKAWVELRGYDSVTGQWVGWPITAYHHWEDQGVHLLGLGNGEIVKLDLDATTQAGQLIVGEAISGFANRGTDQRKQTTILRVPMRRGVGVFGATTEPVVELYYRDKPANWIGPKTISLGNAGDYDIVKEKRIVGKPYQRRQWRLRVSASVATAIGPIEETVEVLED